LNRKPSKQEITASEMGGNDQFALQKSWAAHVSDGSMLLKKSVTDSERAIFYSY
jgi:hypothetical protein